MLFAAASRILPALPIGTGDRRIANELYRHHRPHMVECTLRGGARMRLDTSQWPEAQAALLRRYDVASVRFIVDHMPPGGVFVDGGAHVGLMSFQVACARGARIHAFEPHPTVAERYRQNAALNPRANVTLNEVGLSDHAGVIAFDLAHHAAGGTDEVPVVTLDDYLREHDIGRVDVLKLDVEGHELQALHGAARALESGTIRAVILEEMHGDTNAPRDLLMGYGFRPVTPPDVRPSFLHSRRQWRPENMGYVR